MKRRLGVLLLCGAVLAPACVKNGQPTPLTLDAIRLGEWALQEFLHGRGNLDDLKADCAAQFGEACPAPQVLLDMVTSAGAQYTAGRASMVGVCK